VPVVISDRHVLTKYWWVLQCAAFFYYFQLMASAKSVIMVCIRFIICVVSFLMIQRSYLRGMPSLKKLGRISRRLIHSSMILFEWGALSILGVKAHWLQENLSPLFAISLVIRHNVSGMPFRSWGERFVYS
jgi:uncharacterized membrane protein